MSQGASQRLSIVASHACTFKFLFSFLNDNFIKPCFKNS